METKNYTWLTIKYKEDAFDIKLSNESHVISEIRSVDSEINIATMLDKKIIYAIQEMVYAEINHKQQMQDKKI
jgi:hypothetical protein